MFKKILITSILALVAVVGVFAGVVAMQPSEFHVERSATIAAPPSVVFAQVNDFHHWDAWSPWTELDPDAKVTFEGPAAGTGAIFKWSGNSDVGEGSMTITESQPYERIQIRLDFVKPLAGTSTVHFTFKPQGNQTVVTWSMNGRNNFISKAMCLFMDMDKMIGDKYEEGLANLNAVVKAKANQ
ncbi:MAG: SRPBCC family protein [Gemmataceae bacterium]